MEIDNIQVYGLDESIVASGLPMLTNYDSSVFESQSLNIHGGDDDSHTNRAVRLVKNPLSSGHLTFLSGIIVQMNITATVKWWEQWQRYHFQQIVSSQSSMHRLRKMAEEGTIRFDEKTPKAAKKAFMSLVRDTTVTDEELAYACPMGLQLTARVTTNYLQLKTMYHQRKHHKLAEWREDFCSFIRTLPQADKFITGDKQQPDCSLCTMSTCDPDYFNNSEDARCHCYFMEIDIFNEYPYHCSSYKRDYNREEPKKD